MPLSLSKEQRQAFVQAGKGAMRGVLESLLHSADGDLRYAEGIKRDRLQGQAQLLEGMLRAMRDDQEATVGSTSRSF